MASKEADYPDRVARTAKHRIIRRHVYQFVRENPDIIISPDDLTLSECKAVVNDLMPQQRVNVLEGDIEKELNQIYEHYEAWREATDE